MCRDLGVRGACPRGPNCTYAHSEVELERFRSRARKTMENVAVRNAGYEPPVNSFSLYSSTTTAVAFTSGYLWYLEKGMKFISLTTYFRRNRCPADILLFVILLKPDCFVLFSQTDFTQEMRMLCYWRQAMVTILRLQTFHAMKLS